MERRRVVEEFRLNSMTVRRDALDAVENILKRERDPEGALAQIITKVQEFLERDGAGSVVSLAAVEAAVTELTKNEDDVREEAMQVVSAFKQPKYLFNPARKTYFLSGEARPLHADADAKIAMLAERFALVHERLMRNELFVPPVMGSGRSYIELTPIESLRGCEGRVVRVLGMITQPEEGVFHLEDLHRSVRADFSHCTVLKGLFTETSIVLAEGEFTADGVFAVHVLGFPPAERRLRSLVSMGVVDPFQVIRTPQEWDTALALERRMEEVMMVFASDLHLDRKEVREGLHTMLEGYTRVGSIPDMFVLCGPFMSTPFGAGRDDRRTFEDLMESLGDLIARFPEIAARSRFVIVPGPSDPGSGRVLPRAPLPPSLTGSLRARVRNLTFATNPCRIRYYTQEIVVFRDDLLSRLRRHCVVPPEPSPSGDYTEHLARTIVDQAHLCPLPLMQQPVYWAHDVALRLFPLPDVIVVADDAEQYHWQYEDCTIFNPGAFHAEGRGIFTVWKPAKRDVEMSSVRPAR